MSGKHGGPREFVCKTWRSTLGCLGAYCLQRRQQLPTTSARRCANAYQASLDHLGYKMDYVRPGTALRADIAGMVALVIPQLAEPYFAELAQGCGSGRLLIVA